MTALQTKATRYVLKYKAAGELWREDDVVCVTQMVFHDASGISKIITHTEMTVCLFLHESTHTDCRGQCVCVCVLHG